MLLHQLQLFLGFLAVAPEAVAHVAPVGFPAAVSSKFSMTSWQKKKANVAQASDYILYTNSYLHFFRSLKEEFFSCLLVHELVEFLVVHFHVFARRFLEFAFHLWVIVPGDGQNFVPSDPLVLVLVENLQKFVEVAQLSLRCLCAR